MLVISRENLRQVSVRWSIRCIPSFRYHDLPYQDCLNKVGTVTLQDYRDDLVALIESLNQPPLLLGHSLGFLVAQMAAKKIEIDGMIFM
mgnify:CR=1 FL=1